MSDGRSVFAVDRGIWEDSDFASEPFTEREAWMWLVGRAAWKDTRARGNTGGPVNLARAEFSVATRYMAEKWQWSKSRVDRFMQRLELRDMIRDTSRDGSKIYFVSKYNEYQVVGLPKRDNERDTDRDAGGTAAGQQRGKEETGKQGNKEAEKKGRSRAPSLALPVPIPPWVPEKEWLAFLEMRQRKRVPNTPHAIELLIADLQKLRAAHDIGAVLDQSTKKGWTGVFPLKADQGGRNGGQFADRSSFGATVSRTVQERNGGGLFDSGDGEVVVAARALPPPGPDDEEGRFGRAADAA